MSAAELRTGWGGWRARCGSRAARRRHRVAPPGRPRARRNGGLTCTQAGTGAPAAWGARAVGVHLCSWPGGPRARCNACRRVEGSGAQLPAGAHLTFLLRCLLEALPLPASRGGRRRVVGCVFLFLSAGAGNRRESRLVIMGGTAGAGACAEIGRAAPPLCRRFPTILAVGRKVALLPTILT